MEGLLPFLTSPAATAAAALFGAVWGSFFNVCIARVPRGQSVARPASHCMGCGAPVRARDNVPVLSWFLLRGRCRACGAPFSARYPLVELIGAALAAALWWRLVGAGADAGVGAGLEEVAAGAGAGVRLARFALYFAFAGVLVVLSFIDLDTQLLPDVITLPAIPVFYLAAFGAHDVSWLARAIGAAAGYLFVRLIADFYYYVLKREGMGLGDAKLLALIGAVLGWKALPLVVFAGAFLGAAVSIPVLLIARRRAGGGGEAGGEASLRHTLIPFGPFLALGALIHLFAGRALLDVLTAGVWT